MLELFFHIFAEFLLQAMAELFFSMGLSSMGETFRRKPNPGMAAIGYGMFGAVLGGLSLLVFRTPLITFGSGRLLNLVVTPIAAGLLMASLGAWKTRRGKVVFRIDRFSYGYLFAFAFALVRYHYLTSLSIH
jgi:hypothetical protein